jgi:sugar/nucleoside kinase (ribokinase family)
MLDVACPAFVPGETVHAPIRVRAGGSPVTASRWAIAAGLAATVVGRIGGDAAGQAVRASLGAAGIEPRLAVDPAGPTGTFLEAGRCEQTTIVADRGANRSLSPDDLGDLSAAAILVSGYVLLHDDTHATGRAALVRGEAGWLAVDAAAARLVTRIGAAEALARMAAANAIFADEDEARALTGADGEAAAAALGAHFRLVCVKLAERGAIATLDGLTERCAPPEQVSGATAGAGDALAGTLLAGLAHGRRLGDALERACAAGAAAAAGRSPQ